MVLSRTRTPCQGVSLVEIYAQFVGHFSLTMGVSDKYRYTFIYFADDPGNISLNKGKHSYASQSRKCPSFHNFGGFLFN